MFLDSPIDILRWCHIFIATDDAILEHSFILKFLVWSSLFGWYIL